MEVTRRYTSSGRKSPNVLDLKFDRLPNKKPVKHFPLFLDWPKREDPVSVVDADALSNTVLILRNIFRLSTVW